MRRRRSIAISAIALVLMVGAPELAPAAGAAATHSASRVELRARSGAHSELATKRRKKKRKLTAAQKKARLVRYMKTHPRLVARKLKTHPGVVRAHLKALGAGGSGKAGAAKFLKKKPKPKPGHHAKPKKKKKKRLTAAQKRKRAKAAAAKKGKKKSTKTHPLGMVGYAEILLLALLPFAAVGALLLGTDRMRRPRAPSPSRRRRTLVITPMSRNH